jgi:transposase
MRDVELFQRALGLQSPWYVDRTEFDADQKRLDLYLDFFQHDAWCTWAETSGLHPMLRFARTVQAQKEGVLRWFQTKISNGILQGLSSLIQTTKARARGYRSTRNFIAMIYLMHGKPPNVQPI